MRSSKAWLLGKTPCSAARTTRPTALALQPGEGDLVVMGQSCRHDWEHTVPKARTAGARMSVTLRHSQLPG